LTDKTRIKWRDLFFSRGLFSRISRDYALLTSSREMPHGDLLCQENEGERQREREKADLFRCHGLTWCNILQFTLANVCFVKQYKHTIYFITLGLLHKK